MREGAEIAELVKAVRSFSGRNAYEVFSDFAEMAAMSIVQVFTLNKDKIEEQLKAIRRKYNPAELKRFGEMLGMMIVAMDEYVKQGRYVDIIAEVFMQLEIYNKNVGQFFTPRSVAELSARMVFDAGKAREVIAKEGYITINEPAVGGGVMILAFAEAMRAAGLNPSKHLLIYAGDIDHRCVCMSYLHFALYGLPAVVVHGDALSLDEWQRWYSPVYIMDRWCFKDKRRCSWR
jgi:hypothetical protein